LDLGRHPGAQPIPGRVIAVLIVIPHRQDVALARYVGGRTTARPPARWRSLPLVDPAAPDAAGQQAERVAGEVVEVGAAIAGVEHAPGEPQIRTPLAVGAAAVAPSAAAGPDDAAVVAVVLGDDDDAAAELARQVVRKGARAYAH
jgi:hypothetical protein